MIKADKGGRAHKHHTKICAENSPSRSLGSIVKLYMCYAHLAFEQIIYIVHAKKNGKGKHRRCLATGDAPSRQEMHPLFHVYNHTVCLYIYIYIEEIGMRSSPTRSSVADGFGGQVGLRCLISRDRGLQHELLLNLGVLLE